MNTEAQKKLVAWNGETYKGASDYYEQFTTDPDFLEYTEDLDPDELLRLAIYAHNGSWGLVPEDLFMLIPEEQDAYAGDFESEAEFAREFFIACGDYDDDKVNYLVIDWQATYNYSLQFDYFSYDVIDIDGNYRKFFWRNQ